MSLTSLSPSPKIDILLPAKERFSPSNAGAISGVVHDLVKASKAAQSYRIIGTRVPVPLMPDHFYGLSPSKSWWRGNNLGLAAAYLNLLRKTGAPDLVEVHSRCQVARYISKKIPSLKINLYLHNDPRQMTGSRTITERHFLLKVPL